MQEKRQSIILIPVPEAEPIVGKLREKFDPSAVKGIPAHITLLFPFIPPHQITSVDLERIKNILQVEKFEFELIEVKTFPGVVYLEPTNREKFITLTTKIFSVFPDYPPSEGKFLPDIIPHLTIGHELGEKFDKCLLETKSIESRLPIKAIAKEAFLMTSLNGEWTVREKFTLL